MPTKRQLFQKVSLTSNAGSVSLSSIPSNFTDLRLLCSVRTSTSAVNEEVRVRFNGSASDTNHSAKLVQGNGTSAAFGTQTKCYLGEATANTAAAAIFSTLEVHLPNYSNGLPKTYFSSSVHENSISTAYIGQVSGLWNSTDAIVSMEISPVAGGNFVAGCTFYLYGITHVPIINGGEVSIRGGFKYHTFRSTGTLQVVEPGDVECLVVAGGGGAAHGGGGAGGVAYARTRIGTGNTTVTVGGGGTTTFYWPAGAGVSGNNSSVGSLVTAVGGGAGGVVSGNGGNGGSGGGGGGNPTATSIPGGTGTSGQGNAGGTGGWTSNNQGAAGGGGAGAAGANTGGSAIGGAGGAGTSAYSAWAGVGGFIGGGGSGGGSTTISGGSGGGGTGGNTGSVTTEGAANTGGGGGGVGTGGTSGNGSKAGGSGIVIIRYPYDGN